ncbi:MAG: methyltransferase domain-containing protein [Gammaproteobacteria bacterium]|nr:methyltransferase domain-containing protein [Gammaproteobacteria bacterium]
MAKQADIHVKILTAASTNELMQVYDGWADRYDRELLEDWGYTSPQKAVHLLLEAMASNDLAVLDAGCGTGLVGVLLKEAGISSLTGIDYSPGMLAEAERKGVYDTLHTIDMNNPLTLPSDSFDAVTCIGTFTSTHVKPQAVTELARVTRSGGVLVFTVRDDYWRSTNFVDLVTELHISGVARIEQIRLEPYIHSEGSECRFVVLRVC